MSTLKNLLCSALSRQCEVIPVSPVIWTTYNLELALHIIVFPSHLILCPMSTELFDKVP